MNITRVTFVNYVAGYFYSNLLLLILVFELSVISGCGTLQNRRRWGEDATLVPDWETIKDAAVNAALSPQTWGPIAGALALQINDTDEKISDWGSEQTPLFGSTENADQWSDTLKEVSRTAYVVTTILTPSGDDPLEWSVSKLKGIVVSDLTVRMTIDTTMFFKERTGRLRPDESGKRSLPSGHTSETTTFTTLAQKNISYMPISSDYKDASNLALYALASATAWSRVEAKKHYPSDVLVGYALGHFITVFFYEAFMGMNTENTPVIAFEPTKDETTVHLIWMF